MISRYALTACLKKFLEEDIGAGDVTTAAVCDGSQEGLARAVARDDSVVAGIEVFREVFTILDDQITFSMHHRDGERVAPGDVIESVSGNVTHMLMAERTALNLLQRMCGIATMTRRYVDAVAGTRAQIIDTRKTAPGLRMLDKYAVTVGGGVNHRMGLYGGVLIKDNHIKAAGGITEAVKRVVNHVPMTLKIEVETVTLDNVDEALAAGVDIIMLDNMDTETMAEAVRRIKGRALVEASGGITLETVGDVAATGVDFISVGALTHSVYATDISLIIE